MCDYVIVVYASAETTVKRALRAPGHDQEKVRFNTEITNSIR